METALLLGAVVVAAGACPLAALIQRRRGRRSGCSVTDTDVAGVNQGTTQHPEAGAIPRDR